jgi:hypothetical protein
MRIAKGAQALSRQKAVEFGGKIQKTTDSNVNNQAIFNSLSRA